MTSVSADGAPANDPGLGESLSVHDTPLRNRVFLAPMSGVSDLPFRNLAWEFGAGLVVSEMVASEALVDGEPEMALKTARGKAVPHVVQLAGREGKWMGMAARMAEANGADIIDINMGCPAKRVTTGYSGSALMRDLDHALTLVEAVVASVKVPVTLKMRLGWDHNSLNADELAGRAESAGVTMITVHGRTRCQFYKGQADWRAVRRVREATALPLVVNGDIDSLNSAREALQQSGADAVMVGRGSYGAPWLAGEIAGSSNQSFADRTKFITETALRHHDSMLSFYGIGAGLRQARKHLSWYLDHLPFAVEGRQRQEILTSESVSAIQRALVGLGAGEYHHAQVAA